MTPIDFIKERSSCMLGARKGKITQLSLFTISIEIPSFIAINVSPLWDGVGWTEDISRGSWRSEGDSQVAGCYCFKPGLGPFVFQSRQIDRFTLLCSSVLFFFFLLLPSSKWGLCEYVIVHTILGGSSFCGSRWVASQNGFHWNLYTMT